MCTYVYVCVYVYDIYTYTQIDKCRRIYIQIDRRRQTYRPPIDRSLTDKHRHKHRHTDRQTVRHIQTSTDKQTRKHANSYKQKWYLTAAPTGGNNMDMFPATKIHSFIAIVSLNLKNSIETTNPLLFKAAHLSKVSCTRN